MAAKVVARVKARGPVIGQARRSVRRDAAQWAKIIEAQRRSALTVVEFCRRRGLAKATFWYWRKHLVRAANEERGATRGQRFLALPIVAPLAECIEVDLGTMRVRLDGARAARVVEAIVARIACAVAR